MDYQETLDNPFFSIPQRKIDDAIEDVKNIFLDIKTGVLTREGSLMVEAIQRYAQANIPVDYWFLDMCDFRGDKVLKKRYEEIVSDIPKAYKKGMRMRLAGKHGVGKTMACACVLKRVVETGQYSALYVNMTDIVNIMASPDVESKYAARRLLLSIDFLVIDEFDSRFIGTDNAADLFGRILEPTIRARVQNQLPLLLCTNTTKVEEAFNGPLRDSIRSLMHMVRLVPVLGADFRQDSEGK